jgi:alkylhydroperoxidase family enzyme
MPRIPYAAEDDPRIAPLIASIRARRNGKLINLDRMLLHSPPYAEGWNTLLGAVRRKLELDPQLRELAICTVAKITGAKYEWHQHAPEYLAAGGPQATLDLLSDVDAAAGARSLTERERAAIQLAIEMTRSVQVSDPSLATARSLFGERQLVELVGTIATYNMVARFLEALGIDERGE